MGDEVLNAAKFTIRLWGPFQVLSPAGLDVTPVSAKAQAMIAMMAVAPDMPIERATFQDHLWSNRMPLQGRNSLRKALSDVRKVFGASADSIVVASGTRLQLEGHFVTLEGEQNPVTKAKFLDGLDPKDPVFDQWLQRQRKDRDQSQTPSTHVEAAPQMRPSPSDIFPAGEFCLELHPAVTGDPLLQFFCDSISDDVGTIIRDICSAAIIDTRSNAVFGPLSFDGSAGLALQFAAVEDGPTAFFQVKIWNINTRELLWSRSKEVPKNQLLKSDGPARSTLVSEISERLIFETRTAQKVKRIPGLPHRILTSLMDVSGSQHDIAEPLLKSARAQSDDPVYSALAAYQMTMTIGEGNTKANEDTREEVEALIACSFDKGKYDSTFLTTSGYALHYLGVTSDFSTNLLFEGTKIAPQQAMCWDHLALYHLGLAEIPQARDASTKALKMSAHSPFRFAYETTRSIIAHAEGDYPTAIYFGQSALSKQPLFSPALRYTTASLALNGKVEKAAALGQRLSKHFSGFRASAETQGQSVFSNPEPARRLTKGLVMAGLQP